MLSRRLVAAALCVAVGLAACSSSSTNSDDRTPTSSAPAVTATSIETPAIAGSNGTVDPPPPPAMIATAHRPGAGQSAVVGGAVLITVSVIADEPIVAFELFADGQLVDRYDLARPMTDPMHIFEWTPTSAGPTAIDTRAIGASGTFVDTNPLWVDAIEDPTGAPAAPTEPSAAVPAGDGGPDITVAAIDDVACIAEISIGGDGSSRGHAVFAASVGSPRYVGVDSVGGDGGTARIPLSDAPVAVRVDGFDDSRTVGSSRTILEGRDGCGGGRWADGPQLADGFLTGVDDVDVAYLYLTVDGVSWSRVPAMEGQFVGRGTHGYDFSRALAPILVNIPAIEFEAWGWKGDQLVDLGVGRYDPADVAPVWPSYAITVIPPSTLTMVREVFVDAAYEVVSTAGVLCGPGVFAACVEEPMTLRWSAIPDDADSGLLQVSQLPFPNGSQPAVRGLLHAEMIARDEMDVIEFPLDLREVAGLAGASPGTAVDAQLGFQDLQVAQADLSLLAPDGTGAVRRSGVPFQTAPLSAPTALYVRIVPFESGQPIGGASNSVDIGIDNVPGVILQERPDFDVEVRIDMPRLANTEFSRCVRIVENPFGSANPDPSVGALAQPVYDTVTARARTWTDAGPQARGLEAGATVCAVIPSPPSKTLIDYIAEVIEFVGYVWDTYVDLWAFLQQKLVEGVVFVTGCEPKDVCTAVASTMLKVGLVALGVPPSLPKFGDLVDIAEGELVDVATTYIVEESGLCPDGLTATCEDIVEEALEWVLDQIVEQASAAAMYGATSGGYSLVLNPDIVVTAEPAGMVDFGFAEIDVTVPTDLEPADTLTTTCYADFEVEATGRVQWTQPDGTFRDEVITKRIIAPVGGTIDLAPIATGGTTTLALMPTDFDRSIHLDGAHQTQLKTAYDNLEAWRHLITRPGNELTATVDVCGRIVTATAVVPTAPPIPSDNPNRPD